MMQYKSKRENDVIMTGADGKEMHSDAEYKRVK